jgi:hypothetical protein
MSGDTREILILMDSDKVKPIVHSLCGSTKTDFALPESIEETFVTDIT